MVPRSLPARWLRRLGAVVAVVALAALSAVAAADSAIIGADAAYRQVQAGSLALVDVRSKDEWGRTGVPRGSLTVSIHDPDGVDGFVRKVLRAVDGDRNRPLAVICASGGRSARAHAILHKAGLTKLYDVTEGMLGRGSAPGWLRRGLPVERCATCENSVSPKRRLVQ